LFDDLFSSHFISAKASSDSITRVATHFMSVRFRLHTLCPLSLGHQHSSAPREGPCADSPQTARVVGVREDLGALKAAPLDGACRLGALSARIRCDHRAEERTTRRRHGASGRSQEEEESTRRGEAPSFLRERSFPYPTSFCCFIHKRRAASFILIIVVFTRTVEERRH